MVDIAGRGALHWLAPAVLLCSLLAVLLGRSSATLLDSTATLAESAFSCDAGEAAPLFPPPGEPPPCEAMEDMVDDAEAPLLLASTGVSSHERAGWSRSELVGPEYRTPPETPPPRG